MSQFGFGTKEEILAQLEGFRLLNKWDEENPVEFTPEEALEAVSCLYNLMPLETRERKDDPRYEGARAMMAALAKLRG